MIAQAHHAANTDHVIISMVKKHNQLAQEIKMYSHVQTRQHNKMKGMVHSSVWQHWVFSCMGTEKKTEKKHTIFSV